MTRLVPLAMMLILAFAPLGVRAAEEAAPSAKAKPGSEHLPKKANKKASDKSKNRSNDSASGKAASAKRPVVHTRVARQKPAGGLVRAGIHPIDDSVQITPFPSQAVATKKAFAQNRRDDLDDAEKAARAAHQEDRWQTVLFHLRDFDARADMEACFWRVVAYYRLGEMARARSIRQLCAFDAHEDAILEGEDAICGGLQPATVMPEMLAAGERPPEPVANPAPYRGAPPARLDR